MEIIRTLFFKPLFGVFDLIAKAPVLNMVQFNGEYGCPTCLHRGSWDSTRIYLPMEECALRTTRKMNKTAVTAQNKGSPHLGIKGNSVFTSIVDWEFGAPVDYMHCVLEGVTKRLLNKWVESCNHSSPFYIGRKIQAIDTELLHQRPPHDFTRAPRSIKKHKSHWKASEFQTWLLFYSLPLLAGYLPPLYLHHLALLVCSMHILLQPELTNGTIEAAHLMLVDFVNLLPELYGDRECTLNSHLLVHLCHYAKQWGPLWVFSAFGFERMNGHLTGHIHSAYRLADQLIFSSKITDSLNSLEDQLVKSESGATLSYLSLDLLAVKENQELISGSYLVGNLIKSSLSLEEQVSIRQITGNQLSHALCFTQIHHQGTMIHSIGHGRSDAKRDSTVCAFRKDSSEMYGVLQRFCLIKSLPVAIFRPYKVSSSFLKSSGRPGRAVLKKYADIDLLSSFVVQVDTQASMELIAVHLEDVICKCIFL